jgi:uncharacterized membrane protein YfcA
VALLLVSSNPAARGRREHRRPDPRLAPDAALLRFVGEEPVRAVGTNLLVGAAGVVGHVPSGIDWTAFAIGAAASVPRALLGARLAGRLDERQLLRAVGTVLLIAGTITLVQAAA